MWVGYWKRTALLFTLTLAPIYLSLSPDRSIVPCSFRLGSGASWLVLPNQRFTVKDLGILARRGAMGAVSPLRRPADRRTTWLTSSWSRTGVAEPRMLLQEATPTLQLASLGETGAAAQGNHSDMRLTSSWRRTGVAAAETPRIECKFFEFFTFFKILRKWQQGDHPCCPLRIQCKPHWERRQRDHRWCLPCCSPRSGQQGDHPCCSTT